MKYTIYHNENYYPIQSGNAILVFYRNLCFSWEDGSSPQLLYSDFGPPEVTELPVLPAGFFTTLSAVAAENQGDPIGAMLTVCANRSFPADDEAAAAHWAQSVNMMIRSLTHGSAAYSEAGFTLTDQDGENASVNLTNILDSHCLPSEQSYQEEDTDMGTSENNADVLSMEELLKIAEEAAPADAPMDDPVLAQATAELPPDPEAESDMAMSDDAVDAIVANMLGDIPAMEEMPPIDETAPLPEDIIPDIPLAEPDPLAVEAPVAEEAATEEPVAEEPTEEAVAEEPTEAPVAEEAAEEAVAEEPIVEEPLVEEPVMEEPVAEEPVIEEPALEEPAAEESAPAEAPAEDSLPIEETPVIEDAPVMEETPAMEDAPVIEETSVMEEVPVMEDAPVEETPVAEEELPMEEPPADAEALLAEEAPLLTPMDSNGAHCVLCVRVDPAEVDLDIPKDSAMMISDNTVIFPENGALLTQDLLTGAKDRSALNESVLAAFAISMERFATQNEEYTLHSLLFSWLLKKLLIVSEDPSAAQKINDTLTFLGCPFRYAETGFTDDAGQTLTVAEVFLRLSERKI